MCAEHIAVVKHTSQYFLAKGFSLNTLVLLYLEDIQHLFISITNIAFKKCETMLLTTLLQLILIYQCGDALGG